MDKTLKKLIDKCQIISFDIFDTCLLRNTVKPEDVFSFVSEKFSYPEFYSNRMEAENNARKIFVEKEEITFDDIYSELKVLSGLADDEINKLQLKELACEKALIVQNPYLFEIYNYAVAQKKRIIFISDMYLPELFIKDLLCSNGYNNYEKVFLSSIENLTKSSGNLYDKVVKEINIKACDILHIGDNYKTDFLNAQKAGFNAFHYEKPLKRAVDKDFFKTEFSFVNPFEKLSPVESLFIGLIINKFFSSPNYKNNFWHDFGYKNVGIMFFGFISWIIRNIKDVDKVYFLARDGFIMKKAYETLTAFNNNVILAEYLYASRQAYVIPSFSTSLSEKDYEYLVNGPRGLSVADYLQRAGLTPETYINKIKKAGFHSISSKVKSGSDYAKLQTLLYFLESDILKSASVLNKNLYDYLEKKEIIRSSKFAIVDIGWNGSMQKALDKILKMNNLSPQIKGLYLGTFYGANDLRLNGYDIKGWLFDCEKPAEFVSIIKKAVAIFEFIHLAPEGSVKRFEQKNAHIVPVFDEDCNKQKIKKAMSLQQGAIEFLEDFMSAQKRLGEEFYVSSQISISPLKRFILNPTFEEAVKFGDLSHKDLNSSIKIAAPPLFFIRKLFPFLEKKAYEKSLWKEGYNKRIESYCFNPKKTVKPQKDFDIEMILKSKHFNKNLKKLKSKYKNKKILFYGAGLLAEKFVENADLTGLDIIGFLDKNHEKTGQKIGQYPIFHPEIIKKSAPDVLVLSVLQKDYVLPYLELIKAQKGLSFLIIDDLFI
ncbi:MAG: hypothetical protein WCK67_10815 [bacterium]